MTPLPERLQEVVDELVRRSGLVRSRGRELRADLERHFQDGLDAGRTVDELLERFGDLEAAAHDFARATPPKSTRSALDAPWTVGGLAGDLFYDLRYAVRNILKRPAMALTAGIVLALGLGSTTVVFTIVSELVLRPIPVEDPSTLVDVWPDVPGGNSFSGFSWNDFQGYRDGATTLETLAAFAGVRVTRGEPGQDERLVAQVVSPEYFPMLGLEPYLGSMRFEPAGSFGAEPTTILSHAMWTEVFGGDTDVLGRSLRLDRTTVTIIGVAPPGFRGHFIGFPVDLWLPVSAAVTFVPGFDPEDPASKPFEMIGRLREGSGSQAAHEELNVLAARLEAQHPEINRGHRVGVTPTTGVDHSLRPAVDRFVAILVGVSTLVLLIACLNVGGVLLIRTLARERDLAVRSAIGAGNGRLLRQLVTETGLLVALGTALGVFLAVYLNGWLSDLVRNLTGGVGPELALDLRALSFTGAAACAAALVAATAPALQVLRRDSASALRTGEGGRTGAARLRSALVVGQVAVSVVLVVTTGLFVRSLLEGSRADPGFEADQLASFTLDLGEVDVTPDQWAPLQQRVRDELGQIPGVTGVAMADAAVVGVARAPALVRIPGVEAPPDEDGWTVDVHVVGARYMTTLGIPLRAGRDFGPEDEAEGVPVAIVNRSFVERFWADGDVVGRSLNVGGSETRVIGVVEDARYLVQDDSPDPLIYRSLAGEHLGRAVVTLRAARPGTLDSTVRSIVTELVPGHLPVSLTPASRVLRDALLPQRLGALLIGGMGLAALLLSAVGLYGLVAFTVSANTRALGVRLALGGTRTDLLTVVLRKGFLLVAAGVALGLVGAAFTGRALRAFLGDVSPTDPLTYGTVILVFGVVALLSSWAPARRAARLHPRDALRSE